MRSLRLLALAVLVATSGVACSPSPGPASAEADAGSLVIVIATGPDRVPFDPKLARIARANEQLTRILGRSIRIELDAALLPQTRDGAEDTVARLVEEVARDIDALAKHDKAELDFARAHFERLVVRYAPGDAAAREHRGIGGGRGTGELDVSHKTVDVARADARALALERGEIAGAILRAHRAVADARYADVLPDSLPPAERKLWFEYHASGNHDARAKGGGRQVGQIDTLALRGMIVLHRLAAREEPDLAARARAWLVGRARELASAYQHQAAEIESAPPSSPFRQAEAAYTGWLRAELPRMTLEERATIAPHLWVVDFRKPSGSDRFTPYTFPGIDPMAFAFEAIDAWIAGGHAPGVDPSTKTGRAEPSLFDTVVCPVSVEHTHGQPRFSQPGRCDGTFYRWALAERSREASFVRGVLARPDVPLATAAFYHAHRLLSAEPDYLRFLRAFEGAPALWKVGADVHREGVFRPSPALLEESRRLWREVPATRGHVLLWFARHAEASYHPEADWPDLLQGSRADAATLAAFLGLAPDDLELLPAAWPAIAKSDARLRVITTKATELLESDLRARPGGRATAGTLAALAHILCEERSMSELGELRAFAEASLRRWPGAGLSEVVDATNPATCKPKRAPAPPARPARKRPLWRQAPGSEGKDPLPR